ncbi:nitrous oxide reductase accessory protein NosL [uncultured Winogradskyella sp.]|uniref:nitrous oxide reductase accessory protein NosL n=1 Tax=uncultured Winogradskyella sp. TaxID=395353 RepID=UPI00260B0E59|nr:nitrous oxide reductase accessory protein NosL [uncultured Winogradskyella sp.]
MKHLGLLLALSLTLGCSKTPESINYGTDMCNYCQMTIVTKTHAAQMVTGKGKQFKFDAIECMIRFLDDKQELVPESNLLITNYNTPGIMINAKTASYVVCEEITSPMGANLTGFISLSQAKTTIDNRDAEFYDWRGIFKKLN